MLRTLFTPRWLTLLGVVVAVCVAFAWLGLWQLSVAQDDAFETLQAERDALVEKPLDEVITPHAAFPADGAGHPVVVEGVYDGSRQFLVPDRVLEEQVGYWVVTPLQVTSSEGADAAAIIPVLRGFVADPADADVPPADPVTVHGELAPGESPSLAEEPLPQGQRGTIDLSTLANEWPEALYNGFVFSTQEQPPVTDEALAHVPPPVLQAGDVDWRNLGYALQWWVFAAFAIFMFVKLLHDAARTPPDDRPTVSTAAPTDERIEPHHV
ncbi:SURF1 family protein [Ornithinimicrobium faecis]|uniref:SURF1-like protein n=1 Tax=Ornithinimicrobium faecis TaxID=2934158 RepID=A0ABY4YQC6_9MICO|nr:MULTISPECIES: SURF1 family protein [unclassified Ornithinimicrobium]USQ78814.1 SURF1 family protein [Ornithinimicrobium sp. HY1793]